MYFQILSPEQANPLGYGMQQGANIANTQANTMGRNLTNALLSAQVPYASQGAQADLLSKQLANQLSQNTLNYAPQMSQAELALRSAQANAQNALPGLYGAEASEALARGGLTNQQAGLLKQQMPFLVQQEQEKVFPDPILSRLNQINIAQKTGMIPPDLLGSIGFGQQNNQPQNVGIPFKANNNLSPATAPNNFSGDTATNYALFGSPYNPIQLAALKKGAETAAATGVKQFNNAQNSANTSADLANQISNLVDQFQTNYKKTNFIGPILGRGPAMTAEAQATDNASQNMAALKAKLIAGGRVTNYEMQYINSLKPNRQMAPETAQMTSDFLKQKSIRIGEEQPFLTAAKNQGIDAQTASNLWQMYNNQRPVYNFSTSSPNTQFQKSWNDYLTPQAINAAQQGKNYVPMPSFASKQQYQSWIQSLTPSDRATVINQLSQQGGK